MLEDSLYLDNLQEFVQDENRIVSYKWLSRKLEVPADAAKQMLYAYVEQCKSSPECVLSVIYTVTGLIDTEQGKSRHVCLVREDELEATKKAFNPVWSIHIYSVQRTNIKDAGTLFTADYDVCKEHISTYSRWSPIIPAKPRPSHSSTTPTVSTSQTTITSITNATSSQSVGKRGGRQGAGKKKAVLQFPQLSNNSINERGEQSITDGSCAESKAVAKPKGAKPLSRKPENKKGGEKQQKTATRGSVASFFNKQSAAAAKKKPALSAKEPSHPPPTADSTHQCSQPTSDPLPYPHPEEPRKKGKDNVKSPKKAHEAVSQSSGREKAGGWLKGLNDSDIDDGSDSEGESVVPIKDEPTSRKRTATRTKSTAKSSITKGQRKRKRIQNLSSDEEDNDTTSVQTGGKGRAEEGECPGGTAGTGGSSSATAGRRRKRVKRLKSKMYTTDDGAMVTERVWESESTDESDTDIKSQSTAGSGAKQSPVKGKEDQCSPARGTKQSLLSNFFRK